tara:strand:- start:10345 stop:10731 length:387 start_codon:yes stop_codon:yes gene_type:complete
MVKCPACGFQYGHSYNYSNEITRLRSLRGKRTKGYIRKLSTEISINIPSEFTQKSYFLFLKGIENVDDRTVDRAIEQYLRAGYHLQGKGFHYIKAMITNESANKKKKLSNEYKRLGRTPKIRRLKNEQ